MTEKKGLWHDQVEIKVATLVEVRRMIRALSKDKSSYLHNVFSDDYCFAAIDEINKVYNNYFNEK